MIRQWERSIPRVFSTADDLDNDNEDDENEVSWGLRTMLRDVPQASKLASDKRWVYYWDMRRWLEKKAILTMVYGEDGMLTRVDRTGFP